MNTPKISIIVPVYKVEKYLKQCLDSILAQTFEDWECILVDDGSPDNSRIICDEFTQKDSRFRVIHKENGGVSSARNLGIDCAKGEYITFVDGDDFLELNFLEDLYEPCFSYNDIDFVHAGCVTYCEDGRILPNQKYDYYVGDDKVYIFKQFRGLVFSKLFSLEVIRINNVRFDEKMKYGEDMTFTIDYLIHSKRYAFIENVGYYYVQRQGSAMNSIMKYEYEREMHAFRHRYSSVYTYIEKFNISKIDSKIRLIQTADSFYTALYSLYSSNYTLTERANKYSKDFCKNYFRLSKYISSYIGRLIILIYRYGGFTLGDYSMRFLNYLVYSKNKLFISIK